MHKIVLIAHNVRSANNIGSLLRTADGLGIDKVFLTGYTPYPKQANDTRLPHIANKLERRINKTALGAEKSVDWQASEISSVINELKTAGYTIAALEQAASSVEINSYSSPDKIALVIGNEVDGLDNQTLDKCDIILEIPMRGAKESFNVAVATAMALFKLRFF